MLEKIKYVLAAIVVFVVMSIIGYNLIDIYPDLGVFWIVCVLAPIYLVAIYFLGKAEQS